MDLHRTEIVTEGSPSVVNIGQPDRFTAHAVCSCGWSGVMFRATPERGAAGALSGARYEADGHRAS